MIILIKLCLKEAETLYSSRRQAQESALKPAHSRGGGSSRYGGQRGRGGRGENINTSRFINKTAVNCSVEQFVSRAQICRLSD